MTVRRIVVADAPGTVFASSAACPLRTVRRPLGDDLGGCPALGWEWLLRDPTMIRQSSLDDITIVIAISSVIGTCAIRGSGWA